MQNTFKAILAACASTAFFAAACSSSPAQTADAKPDPRQGEQVKNICFQSQIRSWRAACDGAYGKGRRICDGAAISGPMAVPCGSLFVVGIIMAEQIE